MNNTIKEEKEVLTDDLQKKYKLDDMIKMVRSEVTEKTQKDLLIKIVKYSF